MTDHPISSRIVVARDVNHSKPRVAGARIMVQQVLELLASGKSVDEIIPDDYFPELTPEDVQACIVYASSAQ